MYSRTGLPYCVEQKLFHRASQVSCLAASRPSHVRAVVVLPGKRKNLQGCAFYKVLAAGKSEHAHGVAK